VCCVQLFLFDVATKSLSDWSRQYSSQLPARLLRQREKVVSVSFLPSLFGARGMAPGQTRKTDSSHSLLLQAHSFLCFVDLEAVRC